MGKSDLELVLFWGVVSENNAAISAGINEPFGH